MAPKADDPHHKLIEACKSLMLEVTSQLPARGRKSNIEASTLEECQEILNDQQRA